MLHRDGLLYRPDGIVLTVTGTDCDPRPLTQDPVRLPVESRRPVAPAAPCVGPQPSRQVWATTHVNGGGHVQHRRWGALAVLMLPVLLISIDNTVLTVALPQISLDFSASGTLLLWIVDIY